MAAAATDGGFDSGLFAVTLTAGGVDVRPAAGVFAEAGTVGCGGATGSGFGDAAAAVTAGRLALGGVGFGADGGGDVTAGVGFAAGRGAMTTGAAGFGAGGATLTRAVPGAGADAALWTGGAGTFVVPLDCGVFVFDSAFFAATLAAGAETLGTPLDSGDCAGTLGAGGLGFTFTPGGVAFGFDSRFFGFDSARFAGSLTAGAGTLTAGGTAGGGFQGGFAGETGLVSVAGDHIAITDGSFTPVYHA